MASTILPELRPASDITLEERRNMAAIETYIRQVMATRDLKLQAQNDLAEARLRQERVLGRLLAEMERNSGGRPPENLSHDVMGLPKLEDMGIARMHSSRWQLEAAVPDKSFEDWLPGSAPRVASSPAPDYAGYLRKLRLRSNRS